MVGAGVQLGKLSLPSRLELVAPPVRLLIDDLERPAFAANSWELMPSPPATSIMRTAQTHMGTYASENWPTYYPLSLNSTLLIRLIHINMPTGKGKRRFLVRDTKPTRLRL